MKEQYRHLIQLFRKKIDTDPKYCFANYKAYRYRYYENEKNDQFFALRNYKNQVLLGKHHRKQDAKRLSVSPFPAYHEMNK